MKELNDLVGLTDEAIASSIYSVKAKVSDILAIDEAFRALEQRAEATERAHSRESLQHIDSLESLRDWKQRAEAAEEKVAELQKQEPVLYALRFKNSRGQPEKLINENCLFRDKEKAAAYGLGGNYVTQESGKMEWVPNPALNPEVIPLFTRPAPAVSLADLVPDDISGKSLSYIADKFQVDISQAQFILAGFNYHRAAIIRNIEEKSK